LIVERAQLSGLAAVVTMVDGGFDPLHPGHVAYFRAASGLGLPVLCNVSSDRWVAAKHPPLLVQAERAEIIDAIRYVDFTYVCPTTTADVLRVLRPRFYVKGADWRGRLPDEEIEICNSAGIEIVFVDTVLDSSTSILHRYLGRRERAEHRDS
jgi:cytidyltransferase-like protein